MPTLQIEDLLAQAQAELCCNAREEADALWTGVRKGGAPTGTGGSYEGRRAALLADEQVMFRLENLYRSSSGATPLGRRAALWLSLALGQQAAAQSGQRRLLRQAAAVVDSFRGQVGRDRLAADDLRLVAARDPDRGRREQAHVALAGLARSLAPMVRDALAGLAQAWSPDRPGENAVRYWHQPLSPFRLDWGEVDLPAIVEGFLAATDELAGRFAHFATRALGLRSLRPWDLDHAVLQLSRAHDAHFPPADASAGLVRGMRACGLHIDGLPIIPELQPRWWPPELRGLPGVGWTVLAVPGEAALQSGRGDEPAVTRARVRPRTVVVADYLLGSQYGWVQLAKATGAALGVLYGRGGFLAERSAPPRLDPAALIVADLSTEPNWLAGQTSLARSEVSRFLSVGCLRAGLLQTALLRQIAARAALAWGIMANPDLDPAPAAAELLARAGGAGSVDGHTYALDLATLDEPGFWPSVFLCELAAGQARAFLRREHGKLMGDRRTGEFLVEYFWRPGRLLPLGQALRAATGTALDARHIVEELSSAAAF
ncbi:MAG: hypothetical protein Q8P31_00315 [Bacillota bacterium]|nr:hypothetical protein [Bacillota bacterium]